GDDNDTAYIDEGRVKLDSNASGFQYLTVGARAELNLSGGALKPTQAVRVDGEITGYGHIGSGGIKGEGTIVASQGTLSIDGHAVSMASTGFLNFKIDEYSASRLKFTYSADVSAITIDNSNQTLEVGYGGVLRIMDAESITNGRIVMTGGS